MSQKRIRLRPAAAPVSFIEISPSKRRRRRKCQTRLSDSDKPIPVQMPAENPGNTESDDGDDSLDEPTVYSKDTRSYSARQERLSEAWGGIREQLRVAVIESSVPNDNCLCCLCSKAGHIFCKQAYFCQPCIESQHSMCNIFHSPVVWKVKTNGMSRFSKLSFSG